MTTPASALPWMPFEVLEEKEDNPFLGWRGIRVSLSRPAIFKEQLRAILRASAHGKVGVMFPMVSGLTEVKDVQDILEDCRRELRERGIFLLPMTPYHRYRVLPFHAH